MKTFAEQAPLGLAFVPGKREAGGETDPLGVPGRGGIRFPLGGQRRHFFFFLALQESVEGERSRKEGTGLLLFCFSD